MRGVKHVEIDASIDKTSPSRVYLGWGVGTVLFNSSTCGVRPRRIMKKRRDGHRDSREGAVIGEIAQDDPGEGAAIGAGVGAVRGARRQAIAQNH